MRVKLLIAIVVAFAVVFAGRFHPLAVDEFHESRDGLASIVTEAMTMERSNELPAVFELADQTSDTVTFRVKETASAPTELVKLDKMGLVREVLRAIKAGEISDAEIINLGSVESLRRAVEDAHR